MRCYHYTNGEALRSMRDGTTYRDKGLLPIRRFIRYGRGKELPSAARDGVIEGLLEPEPKEWIEQDRYPGMWGHLMHDVIRKKDIYLVSFNIQKKDNAYIIDRGLMENALYKEVYRQELDEEAMNKACAEYFASRVPAEEYAGGYALPQFAIWGSIPFSRLKIEKKFDGDELWKRALELADISYQRFAKKHPELVQPDEAHGQ